MREFRFFLILLLTILILHCSYSSSNTQVKRYLEESCSDFSQSKELQYTQDMRVNWFFQSSWSLCVAIEKTDSIGWLGFGFSRSTSMVSDPFANIILWRGESTPYVGLMTGMEASAMVPQTKRGSAEILQSSNVDDSMRVVVRYNLSYNSPDDVEINKNGTNFVVLAYGDDWENMQSTGQFGIVQINFDNDEIREVLRSSMKPYSLYLLLITLFCFVVMGVVATKTTFSRKKVAHALSYRTLGMSNEKSPRLVKYGCNIVGALLGITWGEGILALVFLFFNVTLFVVYTIMTSTISTPNYNGSAIVSGNICIFNLVLLLLPLNRWNILAWAFGASYAKIIKLHRFLAMYTVFMMCFHLLLAFNLCGGLFSKEACGAHQTIPFYGFLAFICFCSMGIFSNKFIKEQCYEIFYYYHRIAVLIGLYFAARHSSTVLSLLIVPASIYILGCLYRFLSYFKVYTATSKYRGSITLLEIPLDKKRSKRPLRKFGAYYKICIPAISLIEWHPFSVISDIDDEESLQFGIKTNLGPGTFTDKFLTYCKVNDSISILVDGPYGHISLDIDQLDVIILVAGGIGITPLIPIWKYCTQLTNPLINVNLVWVVSKTSEFFAFENYIFTEGGDKMNPKCSFSRQLYVSKALEGGRITTFNGEPQSYSAGYPDLMCIYTQAANNGRKVGVIASGPKGLIDEAQIAAEVMEFSFHKEIFSF